MKESKPEEIHAEERMRQIVGFQNMSVGATDLDAIIEWKNKGFILIEVKYGSNELKYGQQLAYERMVDDWSKPAICILARHYTHNPKNNIDLASCKVDEFYINGEWKNGTGFTVDKLSQKFIEEKL